MDFKGFAKHRLIRQTIMGLVFVTILFGGWRYPLLGYFIPLCMLLGMSIAVFKGRLWCDWYCPRGSFYDLFIKPISANKTIPALLKGVPLRVAVVLLLMTIMTWQLVSRWPDELSIGHFFVIMLTVTTVIGLVLAIIYQQRAWCCFCPIGSMTNWLGRHRYPLWIDSSKCTDCKRCYEVCPIQVAPFQFKRESREIVRDGDCLKCRLCVYACPPKALTL